MRYMVMRAVIERVVSHRWRRSCPTMRYAAPARYAKSDGGRVARWRAWRGIGQSRDSTLPLCSQCARMEGDNVMRQYEDLLIDLLLDYGFTLEEASRLIRLRERIDLLRRRQSIRREETSRPADESRERWN